MKQIVSQKEKEKMDQLLDEKFVKNFLDSNLSTFFKDSQKIKKITRNVYKNSRGKYSYTLVLEFVLEILFKDGSVKEKSVFCKAHSEEEKNKALYYMDILYKNGFNDGQYQVPRPLIYLPDLRAGFYEGVIGHNLLYYIKNKEYKKIKIIVKDAARWIAKLHNFDTINFKPLEISSSRIENVRPHPKKLWHDMERDYKKLYIEYHPLHKKALDYEKKLLKITKKQDKSKIVYGDFHPENIIVPSHAQEGVTVIDFTDLSIGDPYRDIGTFLQQISFMPQRFSSRIKIPAKKTDQFQKIFLDEYLKQGGIVFTSLDWQRINLYRLSTALRNIAYYFYQCDPKQLIWHLIDESKIYLEKLEKKEIGL